MTWTDLSGAFGYGTKLTSTQMQNLRDNIAAMCNGDSGAPEVDPEALGFEVTVAAGGCGIWTLPTSVNCLVTSETSMTTIGAIPFEKQAGFNNLYLIGRIKNAGSGKIAAFRAQIAGIGNSGEIQNSSTTAENHKSTALNITSCTNGTEYSILIQGETEAAGIAVMEGFTITMSE